MSDESMFAKVNPRLVTSTDFSDSELQHSNGMEDDYLRQEGKRPIGYSLFGSQKFNLDDAVTSQSDGDSDAALLLPENLTTDVAASILDSSFFPSPLI